MNKRSLCERIVLPPGFERLSLKVVPQEMQLMVSVRQILKDKDMKMQEEKSSVNDKKTIRQRRVVGAVMEINIDIVK